MGGATLRLEGDDGRRGAVYASLLDRFEARPATWRQTVLRAAGVRCLGEMTTSQLESLANRLPTPAAEPAVARPIDTELRAKMAEAARRRWARVKSS